MSGRIYEVESYIGESDQACHAAKGRTKRTEVMFGEAGYAYVYLVYGMYCCLNVVTERDGFPAAVLIRGVIMQPTQSISVSKRGTPSPLPLSSSDPGFNNNGQGEIILDGPGKICREMHITRAQNRENLVSSDRLLIVDDGYKVKKSRIVTTPRIGVAYAGKDALLPWRYLWKGTEYRGMN